MAYTIAVYDYAKGRRLFDYSNLKMACLHAEAEIRARVHGDFLRRRYGTAWSVFRKKNSLVYFSSDVLLITIDKYESDRKVKKKVEGKVAEP